jgi:hypothetical protein
MDAMEHWHIHDREVFPKPSSDLLYKTYSCLQRWRMSLGALTADEHKLDELFVQVRGWVFHRSLVLYFVFRLVRLLSSYLKLVQPGTYQMLLRAA